MKVNGWISEESFSFGFWMKMVMREQDGGEEKKEEDVVFIED